MKVREREEQEGEELGVKASASWVHASTDRGVDHLFFSKQQQQQRQQHIMGQIRGADKPGPNVVSDSPPSLLSSFAGLLEGGVLSVFGSSVTEKKSTQQQQQQRVGSLQTIPLNHIVETSAGDGVASKKKSSTTSSSNSRPGSASAKHLRLTRPPSETTSENDMPGLERLERSTCAASSEDEARPEVSSSSS